MSKPAVQLGEAEDLVCSECDGAIERGYGLADETKDGYVIRTSEVICDTCGFTEIGYAGCAPTLSDFEAAGDGLIRFELEDGSVTNSQVTDEN